MKIIVSRRYLDIIQAQTMYDPDNPNEPLDVYDTETFDIEDPNNIEEVNNIDESQPISNNLPEVTTDDIYDTIEDEQEQEVEKELPEITTETQYPKFDTAFQALRWAKHNNETVRINYITEKGIAIIRDIEPHGDFFARTTGRRILVTWDETIGAIRSFIVSAINKYQFTGEKFSPKFNFSQRQKNYKRRIRERKDRRENNKQRGVDYGVKYIPFDQSSKSTRRH